jgi:hypothetical protein
LLAVDQWHGAPALAKIANVHMVGGIVFPGSPGVVNPLMDTQKYLPRSVYTENYGMYDDQLEIELHQEKLRETDVTKQRALMRDFEKRVIGYRGA